MIPPASSVSSPLGRRTTGALVALVTIVHGGLLASNAVRHSPTYDEPHHLAAGLRILQEGRFDLDPGNPPLVKVCAAAPVLVAGWLHPSPIPAEGVAPPDVAWEVAGCRSFWPFAVGRLACCVFSLIGAAVCFAWAAELYGSAGGLIAMTLWCFCPNVLGHAPLVTGDVAVTSLGMGACYAYWRWLRSPTWGRALATGLVLGIAQSAKFVAVVLYAAFLLEWIVWRTGRGDPDGPPRPRLFHLVLIFALSFYTININYSFKGSLRTLDSFDFMSRASAPWCQALGDVVGIEGGRIRAWTGSVPMPLPAPYLAGLDAVRRFGGSGMPSYLRGVWSEDGWWYYFVYGLAIKVPLGTLVLVALAAASTSSRPDRPRRRRDEFCLLAPAALIVLFVSTQTRLNQHVRYVLPCLPFLFVWTGSLAASRRRWVACTTALALAWTIASSFSSRPHHISYFNELAGGSRYGHRHLLDSNIDWGQDLFLLKEYLEAQGIDATIGLAYFGPGDPRTFGIRYRIPPLGLSGRGTAAPEDVGPRPGIYAVSANFLFGMGFSLPDGSGGRIDVDQGAYEYFRFFRPVARLGFSIYVFRIDETDADRVRGRLGLPPIGRS